MGKKNFERQIHVTSTAEDIALKARLEQVDSFLLTKNDAAPVAKSQSSVIRDTFSMPPGDYSIIAYMRARAAKQGLIVTKSEIVRAGLKVLMQSDDFNLTDAIKNLEKIPLGRKR